MVLVMVEHLVLVVVALLMLLLGLVVEQVQLNHPQLLAQLTPMVMVVLVKLGGLILVVAVEDLIEEVPLQIMHIRVVLVDPV